VVNTLLSSAQQAQLDQFNSYARQHLAPLVDKLIAHEACLKEFLQKLGQDGYLGLSVPKEFGGTGGNLLETALLVEALGDFDPGLGLTIGNHVAVIEVLKRFGTDQQKSKYIPLLARGEMFATMAFSEENAGTDFENVSATVSGAHELNAAKRWVVTGDFANVFLVLARDSEGQPVVVLVDRPSSGDSFKLVRERKLMGMQSAYVNDIEFKGCKFAAENKFAGNARDIALFAMDVSKVVLAAAGLGMLNSSRDKAVEHGRERQQFGQNIGQFQGVQWKLADMECERVASTLLIYRAALSIDEAPEEFRKYASMCKWYAIRAARFHSGEAIQILGADGLEAGGVLPRFYDDAKVMEIAQGTAEFQKLLLVKELNI
jgi:alkylation response protein AidB-like acyl-CoA dehydrogenase